MGRWPGFCLWRCSALIVGLAVTLRAPRTDRTRAGYLLWGLWILTMVVVFSGAEGTIHSYYTVILAPGIAALAGGGSVEMWRLARRDPRWAWLLPAGIAGSAVWSALLLGRVSGYAPGLAIAVLVAGLAAAAGLLYVLLRPAGHPAATIRRASTYALVGVRASTYALVGVAIAALLAGPFAYAVSTVGRGVSGATAAAGPATSGPSTSASSSSELDVNERLMDYLTENRGDARYLVAVQATSESVPIILDTGQAVVTIGGYKSRDPVPTVAEFERMVSAGDLHYVYLTSERVRSSSPGGSAASGEAATSTGDVLQAVVDWVIANGTAIDASEYGGSAESSAGTLYYLP